MPLFLIILIAFLTGCVCGGLSVLVAFGYVAFFAEQDELARQECTP